MLEDNVGFDHFTKYSSWKRLVVSIALLTHLAASFNHHNNGNSHQKCTTWRTCTHVTPVDQYSCAEKFVLREVQKAVYPEELKCLTQGRPVRKGSPIVTLDPFIDQDGLICVGGRLKNSTLSSSEKHPIVVPGKSH